MTQLVALTQDLTAAGFVALGVAVAYRWYRERTQTQGRLALALISLAVVAGLGRLPASGALSVVEIVAFMLSAYFVLLFRDEVIPLRPAVRRYADVLLAASIVIGVLLSTVLRDSSSLVVTGLGFLLIAVWSLFTGEPIVRFWLASNHLPAVQQARMRFLSAGFGLLIVILFVDVLGGSAVKQASAIVATQLVALIAVPFIYVSLAPPALLRRIWRMREENALREAMQDLLIFIPTRNELAERAVIWAARLLGAKSGFIVDPKGDVIATTGISPEEAAATVSTKTGRPADIVVTPLHFPEGQGSLTVIPDVFTPVFGTDEISQLRAYANSISAGLQRVSVTERMAAIEQNKTQFLNLASHELRGPITVIRGYVSMFEGGMLGQLNERGRKAAEVMATKVSEMNELIEEMIEAARLEEGGVTLRAVETDLREIVQAAAESVTPLAQATHRLKLDLPERQVKVRIDPDRTKTIIANLLSNAIKYSPDGGDIVCQVRTRAGVAKVSVTDEGLGISRANMATLFTRFGRVVTPQTEHLKGTGLGLFLARQLARLQGGDITVASVEGEGSTFTLQLPSLVAHEDGASLDGARRVKDEFSTARRP